MLAVDSPFEDRFGEVVRAWVAPTQDEVGVDFFAAFLDPQASQGTFIECYVDSEAFIAHAKGVDPELRAALYAIASPVSFDVYGEISQEARELIAAGMPTYHRTEAATTPKAAGSFSVSRSDA
ncbi:hypothetical protein ACFWAY_26300 [Rhodococcus sp. NPDC059968]|uniref:hypothetical protein n=1 Tax=Rhodococcus sp. NPDC059968 TaxID=3347017 RepID=UPI003671A5D9